MSVNDAFVNNFPPISDEAWRARVMADLKGKSFDDTLIWEDENGIKHQPYYRNSDVKDNTLVKEIQDVQKKNTDWEILQVFAADSNNLKSKIENALKNGVDKVVVSAVSNTKQLKKALGESMIEKDQLHLEIQELATNHLSKNYFCDPIGEMIKNGRKNEKDLLALASIFQKRLNQLKPDHFLVVDGSIYKNAGASIVKELAYTLHHAVEYMDYLTESGYTAEAAGRSFIFKLGFGTSYFSEIAKARAFRYLIKKVYDAYRIKCHVRIWGEASTYYHATKDPYNNLLRLSSQCMAAVLGNCNMVSLPAYDQWEKSSSLGRRMSKNIPLILKHESYFNKVNDAAKGTYYIEKLSAEIAAKSWQAFLTIEKQGGLFAQLENNALETALNADRSNRKTHYKDQQRTVVGVNHYPNPTAKELEVSSPPLNGINSTLLSNDLPS